MKSIAPEGILSSSPTKCFDNFLHFGRTDLCLIRSACNIVTYHRLSIISSKLCTIPGKSHRTPESGAGQHIR